MEKRDKKLLLLMGLKVRELRVLKGITQEELAIALQLTRPSICNIEAGNQSLTPQSMLRLSKIFNCTITDLFPNVSEYEIFIPPFKICREEKVKSKISKLKEKLAKLEEQIS